MNILALLIPVALALATFGSCSFCGPCARQYEDLDGAAAWNLFDDD